LEKPGNISTKALEYFGGHSEPRGTALAMLVRRLKKNIFPAKPTKPKNLIHFAMDFHKEARPAHPPGTSLPEKGRPILTLRKRGRGQNGPFSLL